MLNPGQPLRTEQELQDYFVTRPNSPLDELRILLEDTDEPQKILFTGHRGSGKSTELSKLTQALRHTFFSVQYTIERTLNLYDLTYVDVMLSLGLELIHVAHVQKLTLRDAILEHVLDFARDITREIEIGTKAEAGVSAELSVLAAKLAAKIGTEDATRRVLRERVSHRLSELIESVNFLSLEIERATNRKLLIIVEDLDKPDLKTAKELFYEHATSLLAPSVTVIYTFPTALRHDNDFMQVRTSFSNVYVLPNIKTRLRNGKPDEGGCERLRSILTKRIEERLFSADALNCLANVSSGVPRELITLAGRACLEARKAARERIEIQDVDAAPSPAAYAPRPTPLRTRRSKIH